MQYVCDAPGDKTWFRIETENEAALDAYSAHDGAIAALEKCFGLSLRRERHNPFENMSP
jgi:hypothetical protein